MTVAAAILGFASSSGGGGGGGGAGWGGNAVTWTNIIGQGIGQTNTQTFGGFAGTVTVAAAITGYGILAYVKNGAPGGTNYTTPFTMVAGDTLSWIVNRPAPGTWVGKVTVTNNGNGKTIATFSYDLEGRNGGNQ